MRIQQIVMNLFGNAIKFTETGGINLVIRPTKDQDTNLELTVEDTGIGITDDKIAMIFDKFTQADDSTSRRYGGSGLGLSIVKSLSEAMGGSVAVESTIGHGSKFIVRLNLLEITNPNRVAMKIVETTPEINMSVKTPRNDFNR